MGSTSFEKRAPQRTCLGCRGVKDKADLIRVVRTPEGSILLDGSGRLNGRGAYVCGREECIRKVLKNGALARSLGTAIPEEIKERLVLEVSG